MKKGLSILLLLSITLLLNAKTSNHQQAKPSGTNLRTLAPNPDSIQYWLSLGGNPYNLISLETFYYNGNNISNSFGLLVNNSNRDSSDWNTYQYDSNNNITYENTAVYLNGLWSDIERNIYTFDNNSNLLSKTSQNANSTPTLTNAYRYVRAYDLNQRIHFDTTYLWNSTDWLESSYGWYVYNNLDQLSSYITYINNGTNYQESMKEDYTYNVNGDLIQIINANSVNGSWVYISRKSFTNDSNGNWTSQLVENWNGAAFQPTQRFTRTYDQNNNLSFEQLEVNNGSGFIVLATTDWIFNGSIIDRIINKNYDNTTFNLVSADSLQYFYSTTSLPSTQTKTFSIFPNPSNDIITFDLAESLISLQVIDMNGKRVKQFESGTLTSNQISISDLAEGIYNVIADTPKGRYSSKLIKR